MDSEVGPYRSPIQGKRRGILMEPQRWDRRDLERSQGYGAKHPIEVCGKEGIEDLAQPIVMQSGAL